MLFRSELLRVLGEHGDWRAAQAWAFGDGRLHWRGAWQSPNHGAPSFVEASRACLLARGQGAPGRAWQSLTLAVQPDHDSDASDPRAVAAAADALGDARKVLIGIGVIAAACAALMTQVSAAFSYASVMLLAIVFGATTLGWNGVYIAELAREAPPGKVALATGASLMFGYGGAVTVPPVCALLRHVSGGYVWPFLLLTLFSVAGVWSLRRRR